VLPHSRTPYLSFNINVAGVVSEISGRFSSATESKREAGPAIDIFELQSKFTRLYIKMITVYANLTTILY